MKQPLVLAAVMACTLAVNVHAATFAYISSPGDGLVTQYQLDENTGALTLVEQTLVGDQVNPLAISPDGKVLFAAQRVKPFQVQGFSIDQKNGHLQAISKAPLADSLAYLSVDRSGHFLLGASYGADLLSVQAIDGGTRPSEQIQTVKTGPHAHSIRTDLSNRFVYAGNLGADHVLQYRLDAKTGSLSPIGTGFVSVPAKTGPRHLAFAPNGKYVYVVGEMSGTVTSFAIDPDSGALTQVAVADGIPASLKLAHGEVRDASNNDLKDDPTPRIWAADLRISADGTLLYMTERTSSSVSAFRLEPDSGQLSFLGNYPVEEKQPRNIALSANGRWLLVTGEKSATVGSYAIGDKGALKRVSEAPSGKGALWIEMLHMPGV